MCGKIQCVAEKCSAVRYDMHNGSRLRIGLLTRCHLIFGFTLLVEDALTTSVTDDVPTSTYNHAFSVETFGT